MKTHVVSESDISLSKDNSHKTFVSTDISPDISAGLDTVQGISRFLRKTSNIYPHTSHLQTQTGGFITPLSCDLKHDITNTKSRNIFVSADLDPDLS